MIHLSELILNLIEVYEIANGVSMRMGEGFSIGWER